MLDRILFVLILGFLLGVMLQSLVYVGWTGMVLGLFVALLFSILYLWSQTFTFLVMCVFVIGCVMGVGRTSLVERSLPISLAPFVDQKLEFEGVVVAEPDVRETAVRLTVEFEKEGDRHKVLVVGQLYPVVKYGDRISVAGTLTLPKSFETETGRTFRYDSYLAVEGIFAVIEGAHIEVVGTSEGIYEIIRRYLSEGRGVLMQSVATALPEPQSGLAAGLIAGGKQGLGPELLDVFTKAGLVHIVVLSGYNVMLVAEGLFGALRVVGRRVAAGIALLSMAIFVLAAGAGPASVRAGVMAGISLIARVAGRTYVIARALILAVLTMVLINPFLLVFHPGFQLSVIATLGLIYGAPITEKWFSFIPNSFFRDLCSSTVAAQISVLPLLLFQTGTFSFISLPANFLALPAIPLAMAFSSLAAVAGFLVPTFAPVLGLPAHAVLSYVIWVAEVVAEIPGVSITLPVFSFVLVVTAYAMMLLYVYRKTLDQAVESFS